jgi:hypothetical protein
VSITSYRLLNLPFNKISRYSEISVSFCSCNKIYKHLQKRECFFYKEKHYYVKVIKYALQLCEVILNRILMNFHTFRLHNELQRRKNFHHGSLKGYSDSECFSTNLMNKPVNQINWKSPKKSVH